MAPSKGKGTSKKKTEDVEVTDEIAQDSDEEGGEESVKAPKKKAKAATPRKSRSKAANPPRAKLFWGVFNQNLKRVAIFEYENKKEAEKQVKELSKGGSEHFLKRIKEEIG
ncbi:MAG: hypothetical protein ACK57Y_03030 [Pirellulaceae bacterium]